MTSPNGNSFSAQTQELGSVPATGVIVPVGGLAGPSLSGSMAELRHHRRASSQSASRRLTWTSAASPTRWPCATTTASMLGKARRAAGGRRAVDEVRRMLARRRGNRYPRSMPLMRRRAQSGRRILLALWGRTARGGAAAVLAGYGNRLVASAHAGLGADIRPHPRMGALAIAWPVGGEGCRLRSVHRCGRCSGGGHCPGFAACARRRIILGRRPRASGAGPHEYGCPIFPPNNPINQDISHAPADPTRPATSRHRRGRSPAPRLRQQPGLRDPLRGRRAAASRRCRSGSAIRRESNPGPYPMPADAPVEGAGKQATSTCWSCRRDLQALELY